MTILFDENTPAMVARALTELDANRVVMSFEDLGWRGLPDTEWLAEIPSFSAPCCVVTFDKNLLRKRGELLAWKESGAVIVILPKGWQTIPPFVFAKKFINHWEETIKKLSKAKPGDAYSLALGGKLTPR